MRLTLAAAVWIALAATTTFLVQSERQISSRERAYRVFEQQAFDATDALARARAAQQAYVAEGQGLQFWVPQVASLVDAGSAALGRLEESGPDAGASTALEDARLRLTQFADVDRRAREYLRSGQPLMAGDVIFMEGGDAIVAAARQIRAAAAAEHGTLDAFVASRRKLEAGSLVGTGGLAAAIVLLLVLGGRARAGEKGEHQEDADQDAGNRQSGDQKRKDQGGLRGDMPGLVPASALKQAAAPADQPPAMAAVRLEAVARLCTDIGRVRDAAGLSSMLGRAADALKASGLIVWLGDTEGADLRPVLAHGYPAQMLARMPAIPRSADNAAAAAYRTGSFQIVHGRPGEPAAIVAPLLGPAGCIGALTAEVARGEEPSASLHAMAILVAAQLTTLVASSTPGADEVAARIAAG